MKVFKKLIIALIAINCVFCGAPVLKEFPNPHKRNITVKRAGVLLIKEYQDANKPRPENLVVILGQARGTNILMPFAGACDDVDTDAAHTASRELYEETGGLIKISADELRREDAVFTGTKGLYLAFRKDSVRKISNSCKHNKHPKKEFHENDDAFAITFKELIRIKDALNAPNNNHVPVVTRSGHQKLIGSAYKGVLAKFIEKRLKQFI